MPVDRLHCAEGFADTPSASLNPTPLTHSHTLCSVPKLRILAQRGRALQPTLPDEMRYQSLPRRQRDALLPLGLGSNAPLHQPLRVEPNWRHSRIAPVRLHKELLLKRVVV